MSRIPMHNRFAEGFVESSSPGDTIDALSSRILPGRPGSASATLRRGARAALGAGWAALRRGIASPLRGRFDAWRERRHAASELFALDDRSLAELGLSRAEIPFVVARPVARRDQRAARRAAAGNDNQPRTECAPNILLIYFVK